MIALLFLLLAAPDDATYDALLARAIAEGREGRTESAAQVLDRAIAMDPRRPEAWIERGGLRFLVKRYDDAIADLETALRIRDDAYARDLLASTFLLTGRNDPAIEQWNRLGKPALGKVRVAGLRHAPEPAVRREVTVEEGERLPGQEHKETVASGTASAVAGGFTAVACMPNTTPVNDNANVTSYILSKAAEANLARVHPIGAVSRESKGELLADIAELKSAGCVAITDDGHPVKTALLMRRAMEYAGMFGMPLIEHCEDPSLKGDGVAHEGYVAATLGLRGMPGACEALGVERGILLSELTGSAFHVAHMSARASLRAVRKGKEAGMRVNRSVGVGVGRQE